MVSLVMLAPQVLVNSKTLELEKQPENNKEEPGTNQEQEAEMKEKEDDSRDPAEKDTNTHNENSAENGTNGNDENRKARSRPFLTYVVSPILVFKGLTIALVGVSFDKNVGVSNYDHLISPGLSVERRICLPLLLSVWSPRVLPWLLLHRQRSSHKVGKAPVLQLPSQMAEPKSNPSWRNSQCRQFVLHSPGNTLLGKNIYWY